MSAHLSSVHVSFTTKTSSTEQMACAQKAVSRDVCCAARPRLALNHCRCVSTSDTCTTDGQDVREETDGLGGPPAAAHQRNGHFAESLCEVNETIEP